MSKLLISIGVAALVFIYVHDSQMVFPSILVALATYVIADLFFGVYAMANSTTFLCACKCLNLSVSDFWFNKEFLFFLSVEDASKNDGSQEHPYFMSKRLSKILVKDDVKRVSKVIKDAKWETRGGPDRQHNFKNIFF